MKVEINTLYWPGTPQTQIAAHKAVMDHLDLPVNYYEEKIPHGVWMDHTVNQSQADVIGFLDSDCVPLTNQAVHRAIRYAATEDTFIGIAQASNHIHPMSHVYAAPAFYFITKSCYERLGRPSFSETRRSDVAEELTYIAEQEGQRYRCIYPTHFEAEPVEGVWRLGNYGFYGVGTLFGDFCYHLYQGRMGNNLDRFVNRCDQIVKGVSFDLQEFHNSTTFKYEGKIVP